MKTTSAVVIGGLAAVTITLGLLSAESLQGIIPKKPFDQEKLTGGAKTRSNLITYHGGTVMTGAPVNVYVIYYGNTFLSSTPTILNTFFADLSTSPQFGVNSTYFDASNATIAPSFHFSPKVYNASSVPDGSLYLDSNYSQGTHIGSKDVPNIIQHAIQVNGLPADQDGVYFVLTAPDVAVSGFCTSFCAYHTTSTSIVAGLHIRYALVPDPAQRCTGCDGNFAVFGQTTTPNGDQGADEMTDSIIHELSETVTDPDLKAWYTSSGAENGDLCNYNYGPGPYFTSNGASANVELNKHYYLIQEIWGNVAQACLAQLPKGK
ncbi:MAG TPA: hypothetical protein VLM42_10245 [Bryobacteraceae bacterium]|nr:hypothetical protein [Bryobacteraceae bacterium]